MKWSMRLMMGMKGLAMMMMMWWWWAKQETRRRASEWAAVASGRLGA